MEDGRHKEENMNKKIFLVLFSVLLLGMATYALGETKTYTFIFDYAGMNKFSEEANKADTETNYYVTQTDTAVSQGTSPRTRYYSYYNGEQASKPLNLSSSDFNRHYEAYTISPKTGKGYQLYGQFVTGTGAGFSQVTGRWTP